MPSDPAFVVPALDLFEELSFDDEPTVILLRAELARTAPSAGPPALPFPLVRAKGARTGAPARRACA